LDEIGVFVAGFAAYVAFWLRLPEGFGGLGPAAGVPGNVIVPQRKIQYFMMNKHKYLS